MAATDIFRQEDTHPLVLLRLYLQMFGADGLSWEPFVIKRSIEDQTRDNISRVCLLKLCAAITVANHDNFWLSWEAFHTLSQALAGKIPTVSHIDNQSISDLLRAVHCAKVIRADLGSLGDLPEFSEEVQRYMAAQLHESGIWYAPEPLDFLNPLLSGRTQVCSVCQNEEEPKEDGLCSYCTNRYDTDDLLKFEPDPALAKKFGKSGVRVVEKYPAQGVIRALARAQKGDLSGFQENADDICALRILEGLEDLEKYQTQLRVPKTAGLADAQKAIAVHNLADPNDPIQIPGAQAKKQGPLSKHLNPVTLGGTALLGAALLRQPRMAGKFLTTAKEVVTKPVQSIGRSMRAGANYVGPGADEFAQGAARSKRVEMMSESLRNLNDSVSSSLSSGGPAVGQVDQFKVLEGGERGLGTVADRLRRAGVLSAGRQQFKNVQLDEATVNRLRQTISEMDQAAAAGRQVDYSKLEGVYKDLGSQARAQAAQGTAKAEKGLWYYGIGERPVEVGAPLIAAAGGVADSTDPETGRERSMGERLARGAAMGGTAAATGALFAGRNLGLGKSNLLTGKGRSWLSAKAVVPAVGGAVVGSALENASADVVGGGTQLINTAFGQKKDQQ